MAQNEPPCKWCFGTKESHKGVNKECVGIAKGYLYAPYTPEDSNPVDHPQHYNEHPSGIEVIEIVRYMNFNLGNAIKYIMRAPYKSDEVQDLEKAVWYLNDEIKRLQGGGTPG